MSCIHDPLSSNPGPWGVAADGRPKLFNLRHTSLQNYDASSNGYFGQAQAAQAAHARKSLLAVPLLTADSGCLQVAPRPSGSNRFGEFREGPLWYRTTGSNGSAALLQSFEQRPLDSFFASAGIADARTSASEIPARRASRCARSTSLRNRSFRMARYEQMKGGSWPTPAGPRARRKR